MRISRSPYAPEVAPKCCLLETLTPQLSKGLARENDPGKPIDALPALLLSPLLQDMQAMRAKHVCRHELDRCPLYAILHGGALAHGEEVLGAITSAYEHWFFEFWMPRMTDDVAAAISMLHNHSIKAANRFFERMQGSIHNASETRAELKKLNDRVATSLESHARTHPELAQDFGPRWQARIVDTRGLAHDIGNIIASYAMGISFAKMQKDPAQSIAMLMNLQNVDFSSIHSIANLVAMVNASRAGLGRVTIEVGKIPKMVLHEEQRVALFRLLNELTTNAIKYRNQENAENLACLEILFRKGTPYLYVIDNGMGIGNTAQLFSKSSEGTHAREHPELAEGDGRGLATIERISEEQGWALTLISGKRLGTMAGISFDPASLKEGLPLPKRRTQRKHASVRPSGATLPRDLLRQAFHRLPLPPSHLAGAQQMLSFPDGTPLAAHRTFSIAGQAISAFQLIPQAWCVAR